MICTTQRSLTPAAAWFFVTRRACLFAAVFAAIASSAATDDTVDKVLRFSTPGIDCYADGTIVLDGECYALVWSPAGKSFSGFNADGTPASDEDFVVLAGELALGGRCRDAIFQIPAGTYAELKDGTWAVCLVDTRMSDGVPAGVRNGLPLRVNRWGTVNGGVSIAPVSASELAIAQGSGSGRPRALAAGTISTGGRASRLSTVPAYTKSPTITAIDLADGIVTLSVADTVPYLSYTIESGRRLGSFAIDGWVDKVDGDDASEIVLETESTSPTRFFRIIRAE